MVYYTAFYAFAYFMVLIPQQFLRYGHLRKLQSVEFWVKSLVFLSLIGIAAGFSYHGDLVALLDEWWGGFEVGERYLVRKMASNTKRLLIYVPLLLILKYFFDKHTHGLYGLSAKGFDWKPYAIMMLLVFPLIMAASFLPDFLKQYPSFKFWRYREIFGLADWQQLSIYWVSYVLAFFFVELIFRGALVVGMERVLRADSILPMVSVYCFLHFGKPMGETISSIFGGYIIGVIALYSRSILGGCFIHVGIALTMDAAAIIQYYLFGRGG